MYRLKPIYDYPDPIYDKVIVYEYPDYNFMFLAIDKIDILSYNKDTKEIVLAEHNVDNRVVTEFLLQQGYRIEFIEEFLYGE